MNQMRFLNSVMLSSLVVVMPVMAARDAADARITLAAGDDAEALRAILAHLIAGLTGAATVQPMKDLS